MERLQIRYNYWTVSGWPWVGATPLGYWNEAYHHGALLEPTVDRPEALKFEDDGGILPVHFVGLEFSGKAPLAGGDLGYEACVANGRGAMPDVVQGALDLNKGKAVSAKLDLSLGSQHTWPSAPACTATRFRRTLPRRAGTLP